MPSLEVLEGLIGTACAVACLYYARQGSLATVPENFQQSAPWHSALGEYARRNPFAAVFGALAFGFLVSSWSMTVMPRSMPLQSPRTVDKLPELTRYVPTPDPAQAAKIASLRTTINADAATIASQNAEIDRLKQLLSKPAIVRTRHGRVRSPAAMVDATASAAPNELKENPIVPGGPAAASDTHSNSAGVAASANAGAAASSPPQPNQGSVTPSGNAPATSAAGTNGNSNTTPANSASAIPH